MLFGDLKNGGSLSIVVENDAMLLIPKPKVARIPLSETAQISQD
jgi:hypothetical protein